MEQNQKFNELLGKPPRSACKYVPAAKNGDPQGIEELCAALGWVAFACPHAISQVYDEIAGTWLEQNIQAVAPCKKIALVNYPSTAVPNTLIEAFWAMITDADKGYDATSITLRAAALASCLDDGFADLAEDAALEHPGCTGADKRSTPQLYSLDTLSHSSKGSLKNDLYRMWVDNNFDPEVLDRDAIGLSKLSPHLKYLNTRILQMHDVWHLVAGYQTSALHEIAISAFQLAQFGHNYSSHFLAVIPMMVQSRSPEGFPFIFQTIAEAWKHGRETPPMMDIEWQDIWQESLGSIRARYNIRAFESSIPPDLLEMAAA